MRIRSLAFQGVGPYRDRQEIDFDQLGPSGLYLINGPTGAGKSTVIDCLTFALYGELSDRSADRSRLRSDFARDTDKTEVDLVFETSAGTFRVIRSPEFMRAKKTGSGLTKSHATCTVVRVLPGGTEETIATNVASANAELARVVGLTREQFVQTVVLPQGKFATFLHADTKERAEVLKRIFTTHLFERIVEILAEDAALVRGQMAEATGAIVAEIRRVSALTGLDDETRLLLERLAADALDDALVGEIDGLIPAFRAACEALREKSLEADAALGRADEQRRLAQTEHQALVRLQKAADAERAAQDEVARARAALASHSGVAGGAGISLDDDIDPECWRHRQTAAEREIGALTALVDTEAAIVGWPEERTARLTAIEAEREHEQGASRRLAEIPGLIAATEALVASRPSAAEVTESQRRKAELDRQGERLDELDGQVELQAGFTRSLEEAEQALRQADDRYQEVSQLYRAGIAAELSRALVEGSPCPVCGAEDHPRPAHAQADPVPVEEVEAALDHLSASRDSRARIAADLDIVTERIREASQQLTTDRDGWAAARRSWAEAEQELRRREEQATDAQTQLSDLRHEEQRLKDEQREREVTIAQLEGQLKERQGQVDAMAAEVASARGTFATVGERSRAVALLARSLDAMAKALAALGEAGAELTAALASREELGSREGFADIVAADSAWEARQQEFLAVEGERRDAETRLDALRRGSVAIVELCTERRDLGDRSRDVVLLAELLAAGRGGDIGLHIYVLKSLFETVMESANRRFESLLNGRYRLVPSAADSGDQRSLQGLGVSVEDRLTGKVRPAKSLSGGETFCASLALALGLSDVVRMNAGGVEINSLFIDEGFGSLDATQLDEVMLMLGHLSSNGRRVGLITHVDSMKSAILERIDVAAASDERPAHLSVTWMA